MTGIAAAKGSNSGGLVVGMNWQAQVYAQPLGTVLTTAQSINNVVSAGARVINNSWGFAERSPTLSQALRAAYDADRLLVHANPYDPAYTSNPNNISDFPNDSGPWIVNVGAMTKTGGALNSTASKTYTDLGGPGENIYSASTPSGVFEYNCFSNTVCILSGTSQAAPFVTGTASLMLGVRPDLRNYEIEHLLKRTAQGYPTFNSQYGYGMVNAYEAVRRVSAPYTLTRGPATFRLTASNQKRTFTSSPASGVPAAAYWADVYEMSFSQTGLRYQNPPMAWLAPTAPGLSGANPNSGAPYVLESTTTTSASVKTFFYFLRTDMQGRTINTWVPYDPAVFRRNGVYEYTVIGVPDNSLNVSLTGPTLLNGFDTASYTATAQGGSGSSYTFRWYHKPPGSSTFTLKATRTKTTATDSYSQYLGTAGFHDFKVEVTRGTETASSTISTQVEELPGCTTDPSIPCLVAADPLPEVFAVRPPQPNPSRGEVTVEYDLPEGADVSVVVYDVAGREVARLVDGYVEGGYREARLDGSALPSGLYIVRVQAGGDVATQRVTVIR